jgi:hypothetical protein
MSGDTPEISATTSTALVVETALMDAITSSRLCVF